MIDLFGFSVFIGVLIGTVIRPFVGLCSFIAFSLSNAIFLVPSLGPWKPTLVIALLTLVVYFVKPPREVYVELTPRVLILLLVLIYGLSAVGAGNKAHAEEYVIDLIKNVLFCWLMISMVRSFKDLNILFLVLMFAGLFNVGIGITLMRSEGASEAAGLFAGRSNYFAAGLVPLLPVGYYYIFVRKPQFVRWLGWGTVAAAVVGLVMTFSRTGFLAAVVALALTFGRRLKNAATYALLGVLVVSALLWTPEGYVEKVKSIRTAQDSSARGRMEVMGQGIKMFLQHPMLGVGPGNLGDVLASEQRIVRRRTLRHAHNQFIEVAAESGIFGIGLFLAFVLSGVRVLVRSRKILAGADVGGDVSRMRDSVMAIVVSNVVIMMFLSTTNSRVTWIAMAMPFCFYQALNNWSQASLGEGSGGRDSATGNADMAPA